MIRSGCAGLGCLVILVACYHEPDPESGRHGGVFRMVLPAAVENLDPHRPMYMTDARAASLVFEGLVSFSLDAALVEPRLAESWVVEEDGRRWVFALRSGVRFQDDVCFPEGRGRPVTPDDVVYSMHRMAEMGQGVDLFSGRIQGFDAFVRGKSKRITGIESVDGQTIAFTLTDGYVSFPKTLASREAYVLPPEAVAYYGDTLGQHPVGTGPFRLVQWHSLQSLRFVRHDGYWRKDEAGRSLPFLDGVEMILADHDTQAVAAFLSGQSHYLEGFRATRDSVMSGSGDAANSWKELKTQSPNIRFFGFNLRGHSPWTRHAELRVAVARAFDRESLFQQIRDVEAIPADALCPNFEIPEGSRIAHDPTAAQKVFQRHEEALKSAPLTIRTNQEYRSLDMLVENLKALGVPVNPEIRPLKYYESLLHDPPQLFRVSFGPSYPDPEQYYALLYSANYPEVNLMGYRCEEYDRIYEEMLVTADPVLRAQQFAALETLLRRDMPVIPVSRHLTTYHLFPKWVRGLHWRHVNLDLSQTWFAPAGPIRAPGKDVETSGP